MDAFKQITLLSMRLSGFKCFTEEAVIPFDNMTIITGGNGRGKSSIADAIAFAVTGLPFFGERGIDRLYSERNPHLMIELRFADETGRNHVLFRSREKDQMTILYDGAPIRQSDLTALFGERDVFLSILNPLYFIEELGEGGRKLLERYLPNVPQEDVLARMEETDREALKHESLLQPEVWMKVHREEIRSLEQNVIYLRGQQDLSASQKEAAERSVAELQERLDSLARELSDLQSRQYDGMDVEEMREQLTDLSTQHEELLREPSAVADTESIDHRLGELRSAAQVPEPYVSALSATVAECGAKVEELGKQYRKAAGILRGFRPGVMCPMCRRLVSDAELPAVRAELQNTVDQIIAQGREAKARRDALAAQDKEAEAAFLRQRAEQASRVQEEIAALNTRRQALTEAADAENQRREAERERILSQIRTLSTSVECGSLSPDEYQRLNDCQTEAQTVSAQLDAARQTLEAVSADYAAKIAGIEAQISEKKQLMEAASRYVGKRTEMIFSALRMNRVQIALFDVVKTTGEVKDVFRFTYSGRNYNRLSLSEKVRAGLEVSELMKRLTGRNYPQFIDNMESVDDLSNVRPTGQMLLAKCVRNAPLSIRSARQDRTERKAA